MSRKRILFLAEGATMAHFVRPPSRSPIPSNQPVRRPFLRAVAILRYLKDKPFAIGELRTMGQAFGRGNLAHLYRRSAPRIAEALQENPPPVTPPSTGEMLSGGILSLTPISTAGQV